MEKVILVNKKDQILGNQDKQNAHIGKGVLHRAVSVWVINSKGEILITRRSKRKLLWPRFWSNSVCSHPYINESYQAAGQRRLKEELGIISKLEYVFKFKYEKPYKKIGWERELCGVVLGTYYGEVSPKADEIEEYKWVSYRELNAWLKKEKESFTPWFFLEKKRLEKLDAFK